MSTMASGVQIVVHGVGREGMIMKGMAMRLFHLGLNNSCVGEITTPSFEVLLLTAQPTRITSQFAYDVALVSTQTMVDDQVAHDSCFVLPMGSLYEGALFVVFEMVILRLTSALSQIAETVQSKHTNLE
eukprot:Gb_14209 [translate_table: standard]